jgi:hypothetical protein
VWQVLAQGGGTPVENNAVIHQLTIAIAAQNKAATESNDIHRNKIQHQQNKEKNKKKIQQRRSNLESSRCFAEQQPGPRATKMKISLILSLNFSNAKMLAWLNMTLCINLRNKGSPMLFLYQAPHEHFLLGSPYSDSSTPSNFTIFTFHEQEPNFNDCQQDYLICHLF